MGALFFFWGVLAAPVGILFYRTAGWCLNRWQWALRALALLVLALLCAGVVYGLLRFTGTVRLPGDNTYSYNDFDATWRDDGAALLSLFGVPLTGTALALASDRRKSGERRGGCHQPPVLR